MKKPSDFETASREQFQTLPAGGYVCEIKRVEERTSQKGKPMIAVAVDIADGEFKDYVRKSFERAYKSNPKAKWPNSGMCYCITENEDGTTNANFKNFVECVKESNPGFEPAWGETFSEGFKHKKIGVVYCREQYKNDNNELRWSTKPDFGHFKSVEDIRNGKYQVPEDKQYKGLIVETAPAYQNDTKGGIPDGFEVIPEDDVPF